MSFLVRPIVADEMDAFVRADGIGFGDRWTLDEDDTWNRDELDRTVAAFDGDDIVATGRNFGLELTLPGDRRVPAAGVSWITTRPTHRRQGLLRQVMRCLVEDARDRGEMVSILTASEGGIYPRFGYGVASRIAKVRLVRNETAFREPTPPGYRLRVVDEDRAASLAAPLFEATRTRVGTVSRPPGWWSAEWVDDDDMPARHRFHVLAERDGTPVGLAVYAIEGLWRDGFTHKEVFVRDLVAVDPEAEAALWRYLCDIDQTVATVAWNVPVDSELPWLLTDPRQVRTESLRDFLWLRPVDTARLLAARGYAAADDLVVEVTEDFAAIDGSTGRFRLRAAPGGSECERTDADPDLRLGLDALGAIVLGGNPPSQLARARRLDASPAVVARADRLFAADRAPYASTWF